MKIVGVIGGSNYIEIDIISMFLQQHYEVKISTSDISIKENYQHLMDLEFAEHLYVCEINSNDHKKLQEFTKDCDHVVFIHPSDIK